MIQLDGNIILLFYDNGAAVGIILGMVAELLKLEIVDKCRQAISGAANMLHHSPYGKYAMKLGPLRDGSFQKLSMVGLECITYNIPKYDLSALEEEVKLYSKQFGLNNISDVYPKEVGGGGAGMVIGMKTPKLLLKTKFVLPSGLLVAETELKDIWGSTLVFGGTIAQITRANQLAGFNCFGSIKGQSF